MYLPSLLSHPNLLTSPLYSRLCEWFYANHDHAFRLNEWSGWQGCNFLDFFSLIYWSWKRMPGSREWTDFPKVTQQGSARPSNGTQVSRHPHFQFIYFISQWTTWVSECVWVCLCVITLVCIPVKKLRSFIGIVISYFSFGDYKTWRKETLLYSCVLSMSFSKWHFGMEYRKGLIQLRPSSKIASSKSLNWGSLRPGSPRQSGFAWSPWILGIRWKLIGRDREDAGSKLEEVGGRGRSLQSRGACQSQVLMQAQNL